MTAPTCPTTSAPSIDSVEDGRARIDALDAALLRLVAERQAVSRRIQQLRRESGGPRVEHARENEIVSRYADALGRPGATMALAVLEHCRGALTP